MVALVWLLFCPNLFFFSHLRWLKYLLILGALLAFPLARIGLAPLALAHNRRR